MATTRGARTTAAKKRASFGLLANGSSGDWEIAIDETTSGDDRWFAQIEGPSVSIYFEIESVDLVGKMIRFFGPRGGLPVNGSAKRNGPLVLSKDKKSPVVLLKDDESDGRFFILVGPTDSLTVRFTIDHDGATQIVEALRQAKEDLDE